jgi:hypothetical protein
MPRIPEIIRTGRTLYVDAVHGRLTGARPDRPSAAYRSILTAILDAQQLLPDASNPVEIVLAGHVHDVGQAAVNLPAYTSMRWTAGAILKSTARQSVDGACVCPGSNSYLINPVIDGGSWLTDGLSRTPLGCNNAGPPNQVVPQNVVVYGGTIFGEADALFIDTRFTTTPASIRCIGTSFFSKFDTVNLWASGAASLIELIGCYGIATGPSTNGGGTLARCLTSQASGLVRAIGGYWKVSGATANNRTVSGNTGTIELDGGVVLEASGAGARTIHGVATIGTASFDPALIDVGATITWKPSALQRRSGASSGVNGNFPFFDAAGNLVDSGSAAATSPAAGALAKYDGSGRINSTGCIVPGNGISYSLASADGSAGALQNGGTISLLTGSAGTAGAAGDGGNGGTLSISAGVGGDTTNGIGGIGGSISLTGGAGGASDNGTGGPGGAISLTAGAGTAGGSASGAGANLNLSAGLGSLTTNHGQVIINSARRRGAVIIHGRSTKDNVFFLDTVNARIGINNAAPSVELDVTGSIRSTAVTTIAIPTVTGDTNYIFLNNLSTQNPTLKWVATGNALGIRFYSGTTEIARFQDNGSCVFSKIGTIGGLNLGDFFLQRGSSQKLDLQDVSLPANPYAFDAVNQVLASIDFKAKSSSTNSRQLGTFQWTWGTNTDASRKARFQLLVSDASASREAMRAEADGANPMLGFYGASAITKPNVTGSRGGNAALASLLTQLANLGLITDGTSA